MSVQRRHARELLVAVNRTEPGTLTRQVEEQLRLAIRAGRLTPGSQLPSSRVLAEDIGVSRGVVSRAYAQLAFEGYIRIHQGATPTVLALAGVEGVARVAMTESAGARYDLRAHLPEVGTFPRSLWLRSVRDSLDGASNADLGYGPSAGLWELRVEVADYLARARGVDVEPARVAITGGVAHSLSLIARLLLRRGGTRMTFEDPSHRLLRKVALAAGQEIATAPVDERGLVVDHIGRAAAVVTSPAHQFPTGVALASGRRSKLVEWATQTGGVIVEDDYGAEFRYDRSPIGALQGSAPENVVYLGSTGKTLAPALRLGWAVLPRELHEAFSQEMASTMLHVSGLDQLAFADFLRRGEFDRHLRRMRDVYRRRRDALVAALEEHLPELPVGGIAAGLHLLVPMPSHEAAAAIRRRARANGVAIETTALHASPGYTGPAALIVGFGTVSEPGLEVAAEIIVQAIRDEEQSSVSRSESAA